MDRETVQRRESARQCGISWVAPDLLPSGRSRLLVGLSRIGAWEQVGELKRERLLRIRQRRDRQQRQEEHSQEGLNETEVNARVGQRSIQLG